jgi:RNA polymerase sigma factor (sigma-70 family)
MKLTDVEDALLLRRYSEEALEEAFSELVRRHFNLVWSAAWRVTRDADLARDVAQTVFVDLARKAGFLPHKVILAGWLYRAANLAAHKFVRKSVRQSERERKCMEIDPASESSSPPDPEIECLLPFLDEALGKLAEADRNALVLRFFAGKNFVQLGAALGVSDDAAQKRLSRALEKLRRYFRSRGLTVSSGTIAASLGVAGAQAAPTGLSALVGSSSLALVSANAAPGFLAFAGKLQTHLTIMKTKLAVLALATVAVSAPLAMQQKTVRSLKAENSALQAQIQSLAAIQSENRELLTSQAEREELLRNHNELISLQNELDEARASGKTALSHELSASAEKLHLAQKHTAYLISEIKARQVSKDTITTLKNIGLAARIFSTDNSDQFPTNFDQIKEIIASEFRDKLDQFEFVPQNRVVSESEPQLLLFREKTARQLPDGTWAKTFCFCDGSVREQISKDGNFEPWESEFLATGPKPAFLK